METPEVALITGNDFFNFGYSLTGKDGAVPHHPLTPWGVSKPIVEQLFTDESGAVLTTAGKAASVIVESVLRAPSLTVVHVNTETVTTSDDFPHLTQPHLGKGQAPLLSNCHGGVPRGDYTLHFEDTVVRDKSFINRGHGLPGVDGSDEFRCQQIALANRPGPFDWFPDRYFRKELLVFGGAVVVTSVKSALEAHGFTFSNAGPRGWDAEEEQRSQIDAAMKAGNSWPRWL